MSISTEIDPIACIGDYVAPDDGGAGYVGPNGELGNPGPYLVAAELPGASHWFLLVAIEDEQSYRYRDEFLRPDRGWSKIEPPDPEIQQSLHHAALHAFSSYMADAESMRKREADWAKAGII